MEGRDDQRSERPDAEEARDLPEPVAGRLAPRTRGPGHERREAQGGSDPAGQDDDAPIDAREAGERCGTADERDATRLENVLLRRAEAAA